MPGSLAIFGAFDQRLVIEQQSIGHPRHGFHAVLLVHLSAALRAGRGSTGNDGDIYPSRRLAGSHSEWYNCRQDFGLELFADTIETLTLEENNGQIH